TAEHVGAGGGLHALGGEQILDTERHAGERLQRTRGAGRVGGVGGRERMLGRFDDIGVERPALFDIGIERGGDSAGGESAVADAIADRGDGEVGKVGHYSITFGTAKKPCSALGALASTSSRLPPSLTTSSRRRSWFGITAVIGSTPVT